MAIHLILSIILFGLTLCFEPSNSVENGSTGSKKMVPVGVILDQDSGVGKMGKSYIAMAVSDFYARYADYKTRLNPAAMKNSVKDPVVAASAALELMKNERVQILIGPQTSEEAKFAINLGNKAQIPIISISAPSPSLSPNQNPFFIRACQGDYSQIKPLTSIFQTFGWRQAIVIYEDTEFGNGLIPYLTDSLQQIETRVLYRSPISPSSTRLNISKELENIKAMDTKVILVHMTALLGSQLFVLAKHAGMISEGYVWIVTTELSTLLGLDPLEKKVIDSMHGVLGVRAYVPNTKTLQDFKTRWNLKRINLFGLWAYDTIWALAKAVELISHESSNASTQSVSSRNSTTTGKVFGLIVSESGKGLLQKLQSTRLEGLSGQFRLIRRQLKVEKYEIINFRGSKSGESETVIGYWMPKKGISADLVENGKVANSSSLEELKQRIIWPGNHHPQVPPKGWVIPAPGKKLRIGVPQTTAGFREFLNIKWDPETFKVTNISGFSYDVFMAALDQLPFKVPHEFFADENNATYDDLLYQIKLQ
ncbi:glutamate receptor 2.8-like [Ziziphus jujuba]|uniref:Glutamate receptor 2.8-like n=1 Tax=Ziziphus jujuba TaxID=326968 RepID=A0ABM4A851_ZIZJJ|nr:glutamate receptor 2.8-like [Ziziphus jujuba]